MNILKSYDGFIAYQVFWNNRCPNKKAYWHIHWLYWSYYRRNWTPFYHLISSFMKSFSSISISYVSFMSVSFVHIISSVFFSSLYILLLWRTLLTEDIFLMHFQLQLLLFLIGKWISQFIFTPANKVLGYIWITLSVCLYIVNTFPS